MIRGIMPEIGVTYSQTQNEHEFCYLIEQNCEM